VWRVSGRRALVFGGTGHVGAAVLAGLAKAGVPTAFTYLSSEARAAGLAAAGGHTAHRVDLREPAAIRAFLDGLADAPDVLVHCAAHPDWRWLDAVDDAGWDAVHAVALRAPFVAVQALAPRMTAGGDIVLCAGLSAARPVPAQPHAAAAHGGIAALTRSLARVLGPQGIRVNCVAVGILDGGTATRIDPQVAADHRKYTALGRTGTATEIAEAILWLALGNRYMSGTILPVAGGI
jgi:3-oxoacyl-[acyl-carrier protein] reductase